MRIDLGIAIAAQHQAETAVRRDLVEHVVVEGHASVDLARCGLVEVDGDCDRGLPRIADDFGAAPRHRLDLHAERAQQRFILGVRANGHAHTAGRGICAEPDADAERAQPSCQSRRVLDLQEQEIAPARAD